MTTKTNKPLPRWKRNTALTIGIIGFSLFISLACTYFAYAGTRQTRQIRQIRQNHRTYEIQFFTIRVQNQLDYTQLKNLGIKKILYRVFKDDEDDGGLYFVNTQYRTLEPALQNLIAEFDFKNLQLCAWMITRNFNWTQNNKLWDYHYENGTRQPIPKLDLFNPEAVKKLVTLFKELASHKIDCILIQDDFIFRYNEGFSNWGKAKFTGVTGVPAREKLMVKKNTPYHSNWNRVKINQVNTVLQLLVKNCKMVNSAVKIGINIYYETPVYTKRAEAWYSHNLSEIAATGVDYIYLMSYHRQIKDEMKLNETANRHLFKKIVAKAYQICKEKLIVKLQIRDWNTSERIPADEVKAYLNLIPPQVERVCFTPVTPEDFDYLREIIREPREKGKRGSEEDKM